MTEQETQPIPKSHGTKSHEEGSTNTSNDTRTVACQTSRCQGKILKPHLINENWKINTVLLVAYKTITILN